MEVLIELLDLEQRGEIESLDRIVIETTGLADPAPILHTVVTHPVLQHHYTVDVVVATVDALNGDTHLDHNPESIRQVSAADSVLITKTDIADQDTVQLLVPRLRSVNPQAQVEDSLYSETYAETLFKPAKIWKAEKTVEVGADLSHSEHLSSDTDSMAITFDGPVDWTGFGIWLSMLLHARGEDVLRVKGFLDVGGTGPVVLNGVQHIIHPPEHLTEWPDEDRASRIVFISRGILAKEILASLEAFRGLVGASPRPLNANSEVRI